MLPPHDQHPRLLQLRQRQRGLRADHQRIQQLLPLHSMLLMQHLKKIQKIQKIQKKVSFHAHDTKP
jgi:hypothetical protein